MSQSAGGQRWWRVALMWFIGLAGVLAVLVALSINSWRFDEWTGFDQPPLDKQGAPIPQGKTLWDWLDLLLVPGVLAVGGAALTVSENRKAQQLQDQRDKVAREIEAQRIEEARRIEEERVQDVRLQEYMEKISELLLAKEIKWRRDDGDTEGEEAATVARALTLTALERLDGKRKGNVLRFLYEARLIGGIDEDNDPFDSRISIYKADISGALLSGMRLDGAWMVNVTLNLADFTDSELSFAKLHGADFTAASLVRARFERASLPNTLFQNADMQGADFTGARFNRGGYSDTVREGRFRGARLAGTDLSGTDITLEQLAEAATIEGATLPDGITHADVEAYRAKQQRPE
jgi:uncharacterized protein YjbI with pentapeptide repeats